MAISETKQNNNSMYYEPATGDYQNDFFEKILDTEYRFDIPYIIDKEEYMSVLEKHSQESRVHDADVLKFTMAYCPKDSEEGGEIYRKCLFAWGCNSPEGSDDFYDCFMFGDCMKENCEDQFEKFVHEILECVVSVDEECTKKVLEQQREERNTINNNIFIIENLLC